MRRKQVVQEVAETFGLMHDAVVKRRPRGALKPNGGTRRILKTETGRNVSHGLLLESLLRRAELEVQVQDGKRPTAILCERCRKVVPLQPKGAIPRWCQDCRTKCTRCGKTKNSPTKPTECRECRDRDPERKESMRKNSSRFWEAMTPEQRSEFARRRIMARTQQQRSESAKKAMAARSKEQRSATAKKRIDAQTPEQRSERGRKAAATLAARRNRSGS